MSHEGVFYAKTDKGTYYWLKRPSGENFVFDYAMYDDLTRRFQIAAYYGIGTQDDDSLKVFNSGRCY